MQVIRGRAVWAKPGGTPLLFLQQEVAGDHGVYAGGVKAADSGSGIVDKAFSEEVEGCVVEHRQSADSAGGLQEFPTERVVGPADGMNADAVATEQSGLERLAMFLLDAADRGEESRAFGAIEVVGRQFLGDRRSKLAEELTALDVDVEVLGGIGIERGGEDAAIAEGARAELHAALEPGDDLVVVEAAHGGVDDGLIGGEVAEAELAVFEDLLDLFPV